MSGRTRAKLISLLFLIFTGCLVFLPSSAGTNINRTFAEAHASPPNPHGTQDSLTQEAHFSAAAHRKGNQVGAESSSVSANALLGGTCINCHVSITTAHT